MNDWLYWFVVACNLFVVAVNVGGLVMLRRILR
jgi:hypothetical protein